MSSTILTTFNDGDVPVIWRREAAGGHIIEYGEQHSYFDCDIDAGRNFGLDVRHSLECAGKLDPEWRINEPH